MKLDPDNLSDIVETKRLMLKKYKAGDGAKFYKLMQENEERLRDSFSVSLAASDTIVNAEKWIKKKIIGWIEHSMFSFGVYDKSSDLYIGDSIIKNIDWKVPKAEIGYCISKEYEGKGLMQEVLLALNELSFNHLGFEKLFLKIQTSNNRSFKLAEKCGYQREGTLKNEYKTHKGQVVDIYYYGITKYQYFEWNEKKS